MEATSEGGSEHSPPLVMIRQGHGMHATADRRSMIELNRKPLWEPAQQRLHRVLGSAEQLNPPVAPVQSTFNQALQLPVYQAHPGNRHSYSGGPVHLPQYGLVGEDQVGKSQFSGFTSPPFQQRRLVASQRSFDSSSTGVINQCGRRGTNTRSVVLSAVSEDDMSSSSSSNHRRYGEVVDQGPEMSDSISSSPRDSNGGGNTPQMTPKHSGRNSSQHSQQQMYPVPGQLLIDPATGQHFIVPTQGASAPAPQPIYYQPMYYPPPHGAPVQPPPPSHHPGAFYGYAPVQGYSVAPLPQFSSRFAVPAYSPNMGGGGRQYQQAACSTDEMTRVGDDASSSPKAPGSPHLGRGVTSFAAGYHQSRRDETDGGGGRPSPPSSQPEDPEGPRDPFRRDVTRSSAEYRQMMSAMDLNGTASTRFGGGGGGMMGAPGSAPVLPQTDQSNSVWWSSSSNRQRQGKGSFSGESTSYTDTESSSRLHHRTTPPTVSSTTVSDSESGRAPPLPYCQQHHSAAAAPATPTTFAAQAMGGQDMSPPTPKPKAIRMEIDLNKPMPEEEELRRAEEERNKAKASRAPPTSFTVSFGDEGGEGEDSGGGGGGKARGGMTLQDAARRGRMARRSVGGGGSAAPSARGAAAAAAASTRPSTTSAALPRQGSSDDKGFLLERLLHGDKGRPATADPSPSSASSSGVHSMGRGSQKDSDNNSDAGTYVIGQSESRQHSTMITSQIIERDSDASSSDTETTVSRSPSPVGRKPRPLTVSSSHPAPSPSAAQTNESSSRLLLSELAKLKEKGGAISPRGASSSIVSSTGGTKARQTLMSALPNRSVFGMAASSAGLTAPRPSALPPPSPSAAAASVGHPMGGERHAHPMHSPQPVASGGTAGGSNFRKSKYRCQSETRADGGRFSMRTSGVNGVVGGSAGGSPQTAPKRPPFKVGGGTRPLSGNIAAEKQRETEMTAWLRRKDYNPMKAAMEAKKAANLKNRSDQFANNRSISFHVGNNGQQRPPPRGSELVRVKSSESLHATAEDEARSHASQRVIAEYSRGVVEDINKLTRQHSKTKDQKALSGLAKVVDQLSTKCKKSIELIRAQNKGCLSVSVEDLLATAVEPPRDDESLTDQLDRLSNAFDAVQRYLEQYSLDDKDLSSSEGEDAGFSSSGGRRMGGGGGPPSTFSSFSAYRQPRGQQGGANGGGTNRSTFTSINTRPGRATNAYRAKLLGGHRSPSGGRPNKNN
ncbi:hypothetical protein PFISCL1PPCAC_2094 [Pristionchus fissidentatus]|uniref:Uncharacterized protein n=1 Tax=Pristionchus fissidentatus TaxID=1538716 RepID=A0AAV5UWZ7_9BILA|nr:hypothetical protein PFISCL1PPCAC_2094 [Pristionchus fissidentatus]